jgi:general secretion pathway protein M
VSLRERIDRLEPRERQLLGVLGAVLAVLLLLLVPIGMSAMLSSQESQNEALRNAIDSIQKGRALVRKRRAERDAIKARYASPAPPLAGFLAKLATETGIDIPESQDRAPIPHGKRYEERSTKIALRKVGMLHLVKFMEKIEQSPHPVVVSRLNIRKRGTEVDSYDVEMIVSAYDRKADTKTKKKSASSQGEEL